MAKDAIVSILILKLFYHMQVIGVYLKRSCEELAKQLRERKKSHCISTLGCETNTIVDKHLI